MGTKTSHAGMLLGVLLLIAAPVGLYVYCVRACRTPWLPPNWELSDLLSSLVFGAGHVLIAACTRNASVRRWAGSCAGLTLVYYSSLTMGACLAELLFSLLPVLSLVVVLLVAKEICHGFTFPAGMCSCCGYDLQGLPEQRCPECGQPFDPMSVAIRQERDRSRFPIHAGLAILAHIPLALGGLVCCLPADIGRSEIIERAGPGICMLGVAVVNITAIRKPEYSRTSGFRTGLMATWVLCLGLGIFGIGWGSSFWPGYQFTILVFMVPPLLSASLAVRRRGVAISSIDRSCQ